MYGKMAAKNIIRNWKNYLIYFITITLDIALMYSFLTLAFSDDIISMSENMSMLSYSIQFLSIGITIISIFFIQHTINFSLMRRKKEIAIYFLLGMEERMIIKIFLFENLCIGIIGFIVGCIAGIGISSLLQQMVLNIFDFAVKLKIDLSMKAFVVVLVLYFLIFFLGLRNAIRVIKRKTIVSLLYDDVKNEKIDSQKRLLPSICIVFFLEIAGIVMLLRALSVQSNTAIIMLALSIIFILTGIFKIYQILPFVFSKMCKKSKKWLYKKANVFLYGQIYSKCETAGRVMAITAILLSASLVTMFVGLVMGEGYKVNIKAEYPFDIAIAIDAKIKSFDDVLEYISEEEVIEKYLEYNLYEDHSIPVEIMKLSDYNYLREICNLETVNLGDQEYIVHCDTWKYVDQIEKAINEKPEILVGGQALKGNASKIYTEPFEQYRMNGSEGYVMVVPDEVAKNLETYKSRLVVEVEGDGKDTLRGKLNKYIRNEWNPEIEAVDGKITISISVKGWGIKNSLTGFTTFSIVGIYLSIIFIIFSGALLALEQLERIEKSRRYYGILRNLGCDETECGKIILKELVLFFLIPLLLPAIMFIIISISANQLFGEFILKQGVIPYYAFLTLGVFFVAYGLYFYATYVLYKKIILI